VNAKLQVLERAITELLAAAPETAASTTMRWWSPLRLDLERIEHGQRRWIYVHAIDLASTSGDYVLFLGFYSDPPGEVFWEGRRMGDLALALAAVRACIIELAPPESLPPPMPDPSAA